MKNIAYFFISGIGTILALVYGQTLIIQFILAYLLWFATIQLKKTANKNALFRLLIPKKIQSILILSFILFIVFVLINSLIKNLTGLIQSFNNYQDNINYLKVQIEDFFHINLVSEVSAFVKNLNIQNILTQFTEILSGLLSNSMMVLIYLLFIFLETDSFNAKIKALFLDDAKRQRFISIFEKIEDSLSRYFRIKTLVSFLTAVLSFMVLWLVGVEASLFWAFLIFMMNYIPTIGSLIATVFPALFSLLQFARFTPALIIILAIGGIQQIMGNLIEPKLMGKTLNISPIVTIVALTIWGQLWGLMGMLLSVPITVVAIIIFSQFEATQKVAILLSEKGDIIIEEGYE